MANYEALFDAYVSSPYGDDEVVEAARAAVFSYFYHHPNKIRHWPAAGTPVLFAVAVQRYLEENNESPLALRERLLAALKECPLPIPEWASKVQGSPAAKLEAINELIQLGAVISDERGGITFWQTPQ